LGICNRKREKQDDKQGDLVHHKVAVVLAVLELLEELCVLKIFVFREPEYVFVALVTPPLHNRYTTVTQALHDISVHTYTRILIQTHESSTEQAAKEAPRTDQGARTSTEQGAKEEHLEFIVVNLDDVDLVEVHEALLVVVRHEVFELRVIQQLVDPEP